MPIVGRLPDIEDGARSVVTDGVGKVVKVHIDPEQVVSRGDISDLAQSATVQSIVNFRNDLGAAGIDAQSERRRDDEQ